MSHLTAITFLGLCLHAVLAPGSAHASASVTDSRPKVSVIAHGVTMDGQVRNDVAQSVGDSIGSCLMKSGTCRVFQPVAAAPAPKRKKPGQYGAIAGNAPALSPVVEPAPGSDFVYAFTLLGEGTSNRLTLKKIDGETSEVVAIEETTTHGGLDMVFTSIPIVLKQLEARSRRETAFPQTQSPAALREIILPAVAMTRAPAVESPGLRAFEESQYRVPAEYGSVDLRHVPKALIYQPMGAIQWINDTWKFCIIHPQPGHRFAVNQSLDVLYDEDGKPYGSLRVDALDSGKIVAGYGRTPTHHPLYRGDVVYGWAPPLR